MRSKESRKPLFELAENQPSTKNKRPRIHQLSEKQLRNFWRRVDKSQPGRCWNWTGGHNGAGRAIIKLYGTQMVSPRVSYAIHFDFDPGQWDVLHTCDNPSCVNPEHLFLGTPQVNADDMVAKGRFVASRGNTKIQPGAEEEAILLDESIPVTVAAKRLGLHRRTVWKRRQQVGKGSKIPGRKSGTWNKDGPNQLG